MGQREVILVGGSVLLQGSGIELSMKNDWSSGEPVDDG
jgi:hypothetical protein